LPKETDGLIPKGLGKGWPQKESFLFEIATLSNKKITLKAVVSSGYIWFLGYNEGISIASSVVDHSN